MKRDTWVAAALFAVLIIVTTLATINQSNQRNTRLSTLSSQPEGARAFYLWLDELGYTVNNDPLAEYAVPAGTTIIMMLNPTEPVTNEAWQQLDPWIAGGGTLIIAGEGFVTGQAMGHFGFQPRVLNTIAARQSATLQQPLWVTPPVNGSVDVRTNSYLETTRTDYITHIAVEQYPLTVSFAQGRGRVILSTVSEPFTNRGLFEESNADFALNTINSAEINGPIWFDEWHHGERITSGDEIVGPTNFLVRTPAGRAILYAGGVLYIALLLRGRRLGRPVPNPAEIVRRSPMEYVRSIANLNRKAGHRRAILAQYRHTVKRELGKRYRLDPNLDDAAFVDKLRDYYPYLDHDALAALLTRLRREDLSEAEMVSLIKEATAWLENQPKRRPNETR